MLLCHQLYTKPCLTRWLWPCSLNQSPEAKNLDHLLSELRAAAQNPTFRNCKLVHALLMDSSHSRLGHPSSHMNPSSSLALCRASKFFIKKSQLSSASDRVDNQTFDLVRGGFMSHYFPSPSCYIKSCFPFKSTLLRPFLQNFSKCWLLTCQPGNLPSKSSFLRRASALDCKVSSSLKQSKSHGVPSPWLPILPTLSRGLHGSLASAPRPSASVWADLNVISLYPLNPCFFS